MKKLMDLKIYGQGSSAGGKFKHVIIKGAGQIGGDVECNDYKIYGNGEIDGNLNADVVKIKGQGEFSANINTKSMKVQGELHVQGDLYADESVVTGNLKCEGDVNAEFCKIEGGFDIKGLLNADILNVNMHWPCKVGEIGGTEIKINNEDKLNFLGIKNLIKSHSDSGLLTVNTIEADEVYLESTHAKVVRGNNIIIGPACKIDLVEYKESFKSNENSSVKKHEKI